MNAPRDPNPAGFRRWVNMNTVGLVLLIVALALSARQVWNVQREEYAPGQVVLRLCHWQLELNYREAIQAVIDAYEKLNPGVKVRQIAVTERIYQNWLNTHLLAKDAPDLCEMGMARMSNDAGYVARFFIPLTEFIDLPNPYNQGTDLEAVPWRDTYIDGMLGGYKAELQDFFSAPSAIFPERLFINVDLLRAAKAALRAAAQPARQPVPAWLQDDQPPATMGQLLTLCDALRKLPRPPGKKPLVPIAGSGYSARMFVEPYFTSFGAKFQEMLDLNLSGEVDGYEMYTALLQGKLTMQTPEVRACYEYIRTLCAQFAEGFMGLDRQSAAFSFVQGNAAMIASGAWDAESLFEQARFPVAVFPFPLPGPGEPFFAHLSGPRCEANAVAGGGYGIYKYSRHQEQAIDFLRFFTSRQMNTLYAQKAGWVPAVIGATTARRMQPFLPSTLGFHPNAKFDFRWDRNLKGQVQGEEARFLQGEIDYDTFAAKVEAHLRSPAYGGDDLWAAEYDDKRTQGRTIERLMAVQLVREFLDPAAKDAHPKYIRALSQQVRNHNGLDFRDRFEKTRGQPIRPNRS